jgi:hypothetical protein
VGVLVKFNIELTDADLTLIGELLDEQPYKKVAGIVRRIQEQINAQVREAVNVASDSSDTSASAPTSANKEG